jgi:hypothetical protein
MLTTVPLPATQWFSIIIDLRVECLVKNSGCNRHQAGNHQDVTGNQST